MSKEKSYTINGKKYLNPYIAISISCDKTFKTARQAFNYVNKTGDDVYFCKEIE